MRIIPEIMFMSKYNHTGKCQKKPTEVFLKIVGVICPANKLFRKLKCKTLFSRTVQFAKSENLNSYNT